MGVRRSGRNNYSSHYSFNDNYKNKYSVYHGRDMRALTKAAEKEIRNFYGQTLYPYLIKTGIAAEVLTDVTREMDVNGIDIVLKDKNGKETNIDEKAQLMYLNNPRKTWSMELRYNNRSGERIDGWFLQCQPDHPEGHDTNYLSLTFIDKADTNSLEDFSADKIKQLTTLFVKVSDITDWLIARGKDTDTLRYEAEEASLIYKERKDELIANGVYDFKEYDDARRITKPEFFSFNGYKDAYYYVSDGKKDIDSCPVNLVIKRQVLEKLPHSKEFVVTPDGVQEQELNNNRFNISSIREQIHNDSIFKSVPSNEHEALQI